MANDALIDTGMDAQPDRARFGRYGRLAPQLGAAAADQLRAECSGCGTHLMAVTLGDGSLSGTCPVCLGHHITAVARPHAAA